MKFALNRFRGHADSTLRGMTMSKSREQDAWERSSGFVYFIGAGDPPSAVKIGIAKADSLERRLRAIQGCNHQPLRVLGVISFSDGERPMEDAMRLEGELHRRFAAAQRFAPGYSGSEWFTAEPHLMAFVADHSTPPDKMGLLSTVATDGPGRTVKAV